LQEARPVQRYDLIIRKWKTSLHRDARSALKLVSIAATLLLAYLIIDLIEDAAVGEEWMIIVPQLTNFSQAMVSGVVQTISGSGYYGIFVLMFLESISLPIPSEVILPFSGYLVSRRLLDFWNVLVLTTLAGVAGAIVDYTIGYRLTRRESLTLRGHRYESIQIAQNWFERYGSIAVFLARMVPGVRTLISFPAGMARMNVANFTLYTTIGCLVWNGTLIYSGLYLANNWHRIVVSENYLTIITTIALIVLAGLFASKRGRKRSPGR
jgi:membrane protein DedA with SNARE-associated domain